MFESVVYNTWPRLSGRLELGARHKGRRMVAKQGRSKWLYDFLLSLSSLIARHVF